uniref:Uncharacterized protein n=1 Tax=Panagrolaimus sp. JU765 TaxID=591449 RepID=A0AC34REE8_9BILA
MTVRVVLPENYLPGYELYYYEYNGDVIKSLRPKSRPIMRKNLSEYSKTRFTKLDGVLQRQFYQISFPTIRRKLWLSSKQTSNLGKKPITRPTRSLFYLGAFLYAEYPEVPLPDESFRVALKNYDNVVFYVVFSVEFKNSVNLSKILRFIEFDVEEVVLKNFSELPKGYEAFMTPNVRAATFDHCDIKMNTLLNLLPNIKRLILKPNPESDWEDLFDYKHPLKLVYIVTSKIKNWKKFSEFLKRQGTNLCIWIDDLNDSEEEKAMKYFKVDFKKDPQQLNAISTNLFLNIKWHGSTVFKISHFVLCI